MMLLLWRRRRRSVGGASRPTAAPWVPTQSSLRASQSPRSHRHTPFSHGARTMLRVLAAEAASSLGAPRGSPFPGAAATLLRHLSADARRTAPPHLTETIFALSSAPGRAGIAVIRISGPRARDVLSLVPPSSAAAAAAAADDGDGSRAAASTVQERALRLRHREAIPTRFACPDTGEVLDRGRGLNSFTFQLNISAFCGIGVPLGGVW